MILLTPTYKKDNEVQKGDIGVKTSGGGGNGHIFIIAGGNSNGRFTYYDQNGTGKHDKMSIRMGIPYNKNTINGILRPKNKQISNSIPNIKSNKNGSSTSNGSITGGRVLLQAAVRKIIKAQQQKILRQKKLSI